MKSKQWIKFLGFINSFSDIPHSEPVWISFEYMYKEDEVKYFVVETYRQNSTKGLHLIQRL